MRRSGGWSRRRPRRFRRRRTGPARVLVGGLEAGADLLVPLHRRATATAAASAGRSPRRAGRSAPGEFRLRQLPERQRGQAQRLSPDDLRGRARGARRAARLRAAPRRLHLRGRAISGGGRRPATTARSTRSRRIPDGEKVPASFHVPLTVEGYRAVYRGYLHDPDLQDARARWPFVCMWDNHEFSWQGWQSIVQARRPDRSRARRVKVAANQAWFEYQPARVAGAERHRSSIRAARR